jgi:hypothetical protein
MAESRGTMGRLKRLEQDVGLLKTAVLHLNDNMKQGFAAVDDRLAGMDNRLAGMEGRLAGVNERLDRLIAVTIEERTLHYERLRDIERRLTRLEERVGVD